MTRLTKYTSKHVHYLFIIYIFIVVVLSFLVYKNIVSKQSDTISLKKEISIKDQHIQLHAKSFVIYDLSSKNVVLGHNEQEKFPLASLSKIISIVAYLDFKKEHSEEITPETRSLIKQILVESDNTGLEELGVSFKTKNNVSLLDLIQTHLMPKLGISDISMQNLTGLDLDETTPSNTSSSKSLATVFAYAYTTYPEIFQDTKFSSIDSLQNTNPYSDKTYGLLASKTGFTDLAGGNLAVVSSPSPGKEYIIVVMGSTKTERFNDVAKLNELLPFISKIKHEK